LGSTIFVLEYEDILMRKEKKKEDICISGKITKT
jgi:hypothetical protein